MICPQCTNEVPVTEAQFLSMYTCPKCQAVYFIDITGQPEFGDMSLPIPVEPSQWGNDVDQAEPVDHVEPVDHGESVDHAEQVDLQTVQTYELSNMQSDLQSDLNSVQNPFEISEPAEIGSEFNTVAMEITDFANQDIAFLAISYDLKVTGLDTKEIMLLFREAVEDLKFGWIAQEIFSTIKNGECEFKNLNPIQAFVLAKRIQFLDIEMEWKQNAQ